MGNQKLGVWIQYRGASRRTSAAIAACRSNGPQMLDHRIAEDDVERTVAEFT